MILFQPKDYFKRICIILSLIGPILLVAQPVQVGQDIDGTSNGENSGNRTALNDDATVMVTTSSIGAANSNHEGYVKVFHLVGNSWEQLGSTLFGENSNDSFGVDMELSADGSILAVSSPQNGDNGFWSGKIRVYQFDGTD